MLVEKRGLCCCKMSVCPSVTRRYSVETAKHILKLSPPSDNHTILVFHTKWYNSPMGNFLTGTLNKVGYENRDLRPLSRLISETIQNTSTVTMECEQTIVSKVSNGTSFSDLEWSLTQIFFIQRQISKKWYKSYTYNCGPIGSLIYGLSKGAIFNNLAWTLTQISMSGHS